MSDNWEDWENEEFTVPILNVPNEEQLKQLEERKLIEDSDNVLTKQLFSNEEEDLAYEELRKMEEKNSEQKQNKQLPKTEKNISKKYVSSNKQKENEQKQKEMSKKIKQEKIMKQRVREIFGEAEEEYDKYAEYEDMFY